MRATLSFATTLAVLAPVVLAQDDPGYPVDNPTISYWQLPPHPDVADHQSAELPETADIVIIGSGLTGASIAWHMLEENDSAAAEKPRIAMVEARRACSGATGRNGGHIRPSAYSEYDAAKQVTSKREAIKVTKLRAGHTAAIIAAAEKLPEDIRTYTSARAVDSLDVFFDQEEWELAVNQTRVLKDEVPEVGDEWDIFEGDDARRMSLMPTAVGVLTSSPKVAGAVWGYRFVTSVLKHVLDTYPVNFSLDTHTTARSVKALSESSSVNSTGHNFEVVTDRGSILTNHVVHAANAWTPHFVPGLSGFLSAWLLHMSAQLGGKGLPDVGKWPALYPNASSLPTGRAWSLFRFGGLDYIVQQPEDNEFMFGGGAGLGHDLDSSQTYNDSQAPDPIYAAYLGGALPTYFGYQRYGPERTAYGDRPDDKNDQVYPGHVKRVWNGVEGKTKDGLPIVGPLDSALTGRVVANETAGKEWVSTGFNGEGMAYTWLSGKGLSEMIKEHIATGGITGGGGGGGGGDSDVLKWFPRAFLISEDRIKNAPDAPGHGERTDVVRRGLFARFGRGAG